MTRLASPPLVRQDVMTSIALTEPTIEVPGEAVAEGSAAEIRVPRRASALLALSARDLDEELQRRLRRRGYTWE